MSTVATLTPQMLPVRRSPLAPTSVANVSEQNDITIGQAVSGLVGAAAVATIETVGNTASSLIQTPRAVGQAYKTLYNTELVGPVLKTAIAVTLPVALVAGPVLTALGSFGFGLFRGATEAVENGLGSAIKEGCNDVKYFNTELAGKLVDGLKELESAALPEGEKPYDIKVLEAGQGLVSGIAGAAIVGGGVGAVVALRTPQCVIRAYEELWKSDDIGPVAKTTLSLLVPPAAIVAAPLGLVGGAVYGLGKGFAKGYSEGITPAIGSAVETVEQVNDGIREALKRD